MQSEQSRPRPQKTIGVLGGMSNQATGEYYRLLTLEQAPRRFNTLSPGPTDTPILNKALADERDVFIDHLSSTLSLQRLGTAEEAGAAVVFLMANRWMNGARLNVDGGMRLV